jgi:signal transduction histidine kinase
MGGSAFQRRRVWLHAMTDRVADVVGRGARERWSDPRGPTTRRHRIEPRFGTPAWSSGPPARAAGDPGEVMAATLELVAHDLRSPLAASRQLVERLLHAHPDDDLAGLADVAAALAQVDTLVTELLGQERLGGLREERFSLQQLAGDAVAACSAPDRVQVLTVACETVGDRSLLKASIGNLLENALRHATHEVLVRVGPVANGTLVVVDDDGPGIPPDLQDLVFQPLVRLDPEGGPGSGLGLTLVRRVVELHGGRVWAETAPGGGARFCLRLPLASPVRRPTGGMRATVGATPA